MKKLMILGAAVLSGAVAFGVTSANTVGYATVTIPAQKLTMIGVQFAAPVQSPADSTAAEHL